MPTGTISDAVHHSFASTPFERQNVVDAMRLGVVTCPPDATLREVARVMPPTASIPWSSPRAQTARPWA